MKKKIVMVMVLAAALSLQACGGSAGGDGQTQESGTQEATESVLQESGGSEESTETQTGTPETETNAGESSLQGESVEKNGVSIVFEEQQKSLTNEEGKELVMVEARWPFVTVDEHPEAAEKINGYFETQKSALEEQAGEFADENQLVQDSGEGLADVAYSIFRFYDAGRLGENSVSFVMNAEEYTGGAHPSHAKAGITFDAASGEILTLNDIFTDKELAVQFVNDQILKQTEEMDQNMFFEGYQDSIKDILTENTWWFSDTGFTVVAGEYLIAPYVAGSFEFTIPYEDFTYLKEEYRR